MSLKKKQFNLKTLLFMCELRIYFKDEADFEKIKNPTLPFFFLVSFMWISYIIETVFYTSVVFKLNVKSFRIYVNTYHNFKEINLYLVHTYYIYLNLNFFCWDLNEKAIF